MTESEQSVDINEALQSAFGLVTSARADLVQTLNTYDSDGRELTRTTLQRLQQLNDPPVSPARTAAVADLTGELADFNHLWIPLVENSGFLLYALSSALTSLLGDMMRIPVKGRPDTGGRDPIADAAAQALAFWDGLEEAVQRNQTLMASATIAANAVAETVQEVAGLLTARLNLMVAFIHRTDPAPENVGVSPRWFAGVVGKSGMNEMALIALEEGLKKVIEEGVSRIPVAGIAVSVIKITQDVREKQKAFRERRELLEKVAAAYRGPGATDDMSNLLAQFQQDDERIKELFLVIDDLIQQLKS